MASEIDRDKSDVNERKPAKGGKSSPPPLPQTRPTFLSDGPEAHRDANC